MATMRALVANSIGEPADVLSLEVRPVPEPGPGQVRIRVQAAPIHASDLHVLRGRFAFAPELPVVPGFESVGVIDKIGDGVEQLERGQRVITLGVIGTWQEYMIAEATRVLGVPVGMRASTAAQLMINPLSGLLMTTRELDIQPGEWLLQTAAGSTVGKVVMQLGRHLGFRTINVVRRRSAVAEILEFGGDQVICTEDEDLRGRVAEIGGPEGVRKAIDCVAGEVGADVFRALAPDGEMVVHGALATHRQTDPDQLTLPLLARSIIYGTKTVRGFWLNRWLSKAAPDEVGTMVARTVELVAGGTIILPEGQPLPLDQFADAVRLAEAPAHGDKPLFVLEQ
jgi:NADPH:quinone reductase-like Zn-dependent oxidoreductase